MADEKNKTDPAEVVEAEPKTGSNDDADDVLLFALASALVPIFFRRRR